MEEDGKSTRYKIEAAIYRIGKRNCDWNQPLRDEDREQLELLAVAFEQQGGTPLELQRIYDEGQRDGTARPSPEVS